MKKHDYIIIVSIAVFIAQNVYFGFNETPQSGAEKVADIVTMILTVWGFASMFLDRERVQHVVTLDGVFMLPREKPTLLQNEIL